MYHYQMSDFNYLIILYLYYFKTIFPLSIVIFLNYFSNFYLLFALIPLKQALLHFFLYFYFIEYFYLNSLLFHLVLLFHIFLFKFQFDLNSYQKNQFFLFDLHLLNLKILKFKIDYYFLLILFLDFNFLLNEKSHFFYFSIHLDL